MLTGKFRIVLILVRHTMREPEEYFYTEFNDPNIEIEIVDKAKTSRVERLIGRMATNLIVTKSKKQYLKYNIKKHKQRNFIAYYLGLIVFYPLSKLKFFKVIYRNFVKKAKILNEAQYLALFDKYQPDLVFSTTIITNTDVAFLLIAQKLGIPNISMPRSWDNIDKFIFKIEPDIFLVQNEEMKKSAINTQVIDPDKIVVIGFPQFDIYQDKECIMSRQEYCVKKNFDPNLPILFLGSEGPWSKGDGKIFKDIITSRGENIPECNILVRPHWGSLKDYDYSDLKDFPNVYIDDDFRMTDFFSDSWDQTPEDMVDFANSIYHCDIMIAFSSTLALDSACLDKPIITIGYGVLYKNNIDVTLEMYKTSHFSRVVETGGISIVKDRSEVFDSINSYLKDPSINAAGREVLRNKLCYKVDGLSGKRLIDSIMTLTKESN